MAQTSSIEWTNATWNPVSGCTKISTGCKNCYAYRMAMRLKAMGQPNYRNGFKTTLHPHALEVPFRWRQPRMIFVNSMSDLFHKDVPLDFIKQVFDTMAGTPRHTYQILTKRSGRLRQVSEKLPWPENVWMGVTVENIDYLHRIEDLRRTDAAVKFISFEPLLGPIPDIDLTDIGWVIVGGESGPNARPMHHDWPMQIKDQCEKKHVPFFFKQWGGPNKKKTGRTLNGKTYNQRPGHKWKGELDYDRIGRAKRRRLAHT